MPKQLGLPFDEPVVLTYPTPGGGWVRRNVPLLIPCQECDKLSPHWLCDDCHKAQRGSPPW
jgi:hypothetical protein